MREKILELMNTKGYSAKTLEELSEILNCNITELKMTLDELEKEYVIKQTKKKKYDLLKRFNLHVGTIEIKEKGFGFITCEEFPEDLFVSKDYIGGSMNKDRVLFSVISGDEIIGARKEAMVIEVIERHLKNVIGRIEAGKGNKKVFVPDDKKLELNFDVVDFGISVIGDVVDFEIEQYVNAYLVRGHIKEVIGNINDVGIDIKAVAYRYGFESEFPKTVMDEVASLKIDIEEEKKRRRFVTGNIITIDGEDAKDLDDAVSVRKLENGNYELGVYIADVSYYVREDSELDKEAFLRGTSVYLADRVIPMLPHKLSNDLCSLNPNEEKLVMCCVMEINEFGEVVNHDIFEGIIKTKYRMTYTSVNKIIEDEDQEEIEKYKDIYEDIMNMYELSLILRDERHIRGSLDFDIPESKIIVNEKGEPIDVVLRTRGAGEKLIEDFMLTANETVASTIFNLNLPFVYRVHDEPNYLKLQKFNTVVKSMGYRLSMKKNSRVSPVALQHLLENIREEDKGLSTLLLRMMAKAKYSERNIGHYGLASDCYTHFTSPIRRYPDLIVHRYLRQYLFEGRVSEKYQDLAYSKIVVAANHSSKKERDAIDCEYEVSDMKKAEYMQKHIGETYEATITSVTNFGLFAALDNTIEGFIHISTLPGYYVYNENRMSLVGPNKEYRLGDRITVRVKKASKELRQVDFAVVGGERFGKRDKDHHKKQKGKS